MKHKFLISDTMTNYGIELSMDGNNKVLDESGNLVDTEKYLNRSKERTKKLNSLTENSSAFGFKANTEEIVQRINSELMGGKSSNFWNAFYSNVPNLNSSSQVNVIYTVSFTPLVMSDMPAYSGSGTAGTYNEGNCGPTAFTNFIKYYKEKRNKTNLYTSGTIEDTYNRLCVLSDYNPTDGVFDNKVLSTFNTYIPERGYSVSSGQFWFNWWSDFTGDIDSGKPLILRVGGNDSSGDHLGHFVVVMGYCKDTSNAGYLRIADGWNATTHRYVKFKPSDLDEFYGFSITIS